MIVKDLVGKRYFEVLETLKKLELANEEMGISWYFLLWEQVEDT